MNRPQSGGLPPGVAARQAALRLLDAVLRRGETLDQAGGRALASIRADNDRALARAIAAEVLRHLPDLDALIDSATQRPLPDDAKARFALRIALAQMLALGTPSHAAIATVLPLVDGGPRKLVHGVFGTLSRRGVTLPDPPALPAATAARWSAQWGDDMVEAARRAMATPPPLDLTLRGAHGPEGLELLAGHRRLPRGTAIPDLPGYDEGAWWVQDLAASLPARLLGLGKGRAIDACAAPGGKTMQLAAASWDVTAIDLAESRLARLGANLDRTDLAAEIVAADATRWSPPTPVEAVLLDAPCSATGIFRRHPDVIHRVHPALIDQMADLQRHLLAHAAGWLRKGGRLVYATCSLERAEGEDQATAFLAANRDFAVDPVQHDELPHGIVPAPEGWVRILPGALEAQGGCDGFFIARFVRAG
ncbi:RsmB/NOP family class I SAM-dependent RNA methyltransferase [Sphingomonas sp.]|jgi:16S rRNA (cytosine967-C5)-methyltransferase|uniref:RsmB/NOP family class I SAM-dependent RNA methyltransferase n=1 Tax=Sphingomonas sp. TaxID=28214 RepID=UPI002E34A2C4|nr:transcription antitermination factor NusB [Sphingomonas sp.]HEX4695340.1 transcription antitermination factor NusB [Sphingomonas sp.]